MKRFLAVFFALFVCAAKGDEIVRPSRLGVSPPPAEPSAPATAATEEENDDETPLATATTEAAAITTPTAPMTAPAATPTISRTAASRAISANKTQTMEAPKGAAVPAIYRASSRSGAAPEAATQRGTGSEGPSRSAVTRNSNNGLRPSVAEVGGRAVIYRTGAMTGSNMNDELRKKPSAARRTRAALDLDDGEAPTAPGAMAGCKEEYFDCLNQFCNVLDPNQKQCSCSNRLTQYKKSEESLALANDELNNVAQQIRYIGLTADEVKSILSETEAEAVLSKTVDRTQSRKMLDEIEKIIMNPKSGATAAGSQFFDIDFGGDGFSDLNSLFGMGSNESFATMRGGDLYNTAKKKCSSILTRCATKKTDQTIISGQYDIEIDKACVAYEAGLKKAAAGVKTNIRSATLMLQKARLAVLDNHNSYDTKGCVAALDSCMKDEMVCGPDYYKCIDPTKTAIDENGEVIPGGDVVMIKTMMRDYQNQLETLLTMPDASPKCTGSNAGDLNPTGICVVNYLKDKIGVSRDNRLQSGFCRPVLDRCRQFTYSNGSYLENNTVVKSYLERTMSQISAAQNNLITEYASRCLQSVSTCYNNQMMQVNAYAGGINLSPSMVKPVLLGSCRNVALSCAYALFPEGNRNDKDKLIDDLSEMFYQAMMCPTNSYWDRNGPRLDNNNPIICADNGGDRCIGTNNMRSDINNIKFINSRCACNVGFYVYNGACVQNYVCPAYSQYNDAAKSIVSGAEGVYGVPIPFCLCDNYGSTTSGSCPAPPKTTS